MTDDILKRAAAAVEGVVPGPWLFRDGRLLAQSTWHDENGAHHDFEYPRILGEVSDDWDEVVNGNFIAEARTLIPDMSAAIAERDAEIDRLTARAEAAEAILADAGALRDAADRVSAWFATEARHLEGPRINGLRMAMVAYDRHMQPAPNAAMKEKQ